MYFSLQFWSNKLEQRGTIWHEEVLGIYRICKPCHFFSKLHSTSETLTAYAHILPARCWSFSGMEVPEIACQS
jgi:hypothetical protein